MDKSILTEVLSNKRVLISHYLNPKLKLVVYLINSVSDKVVVFDEKNYLVKTSLINSVKENVIVSNNMNVTPPVDYRLVYIEPSVFPPRLRNRNILVTLTPGNYCFKIPRYYSRVYLRRVSENQFIIHVSETMEKYRFRIVDNDIEFIDQPEGVYGRVYELIRKTILEYGELTVKDAVNIVARELGISRENARKLISKLVLDKYVRVEKGFISLY